MRDWARAQRLEAYDQAEHTGFLRHLVVREGRNTGQTLVQLVTAPGMLDVDSFVAALERFAEVRSIHWSVNDRPAEVTNLPTQLLHGVDAIEEELCGLRFRVRPNAFLQTNTAMAERLYELVREFAGLTGEESVYDLYCGIGTIGLTLARDALTVWGIEASEESVACALENAELNGIANAAFYAGEVGESIDDLRERAGAPDVAVVDPPRAGLSGKALRRLARLEPSASSTSPATRRRSPATSKSSRQSGATGSCARGPWTCSRTRRTSRRSRCSNAASRLARWSATPHASSERSLRQSRSAFGARKPSASSGSAGSPATSRWMIAVTRP